MSRFSLEGKKALVTGANTGIGQAIAVSLAAAGAQVVCGGRRSCDETIGKIHDAGGAASALIIDFADPMAGRDVFADAGYDILVNNAGIIRREDSVDFSETDWDDVMDVNAKALFFTCQAFAKEALAQGRAVLQAQAVSPSEAAKAGLSVSHDGVRRSGIDLLAFPGVDVAALAGLFPVAAEIAPDIARQIEVDAQYADYVARQKEDVAAMRRDEALPLGDLLDAAQIPGLSRELHDKLRRIRPDTLAAAGRIEGMTPAALTLLAAHLRKRERAAS